MDTLYWHIQYMHILTYRHKECCHMHTHTHNKTAPTHWSGRLTHSCHEQTDQFITQLLNSNHIYPPLGTVGESTIQALSQPLCYLGSVLVYRGSLRQSGREMGMNEWLQSFLKWHCALLLALCKAGSWYSVFCICIYKRLSSQEKNRKKIASLLSANGQIWNIFTFYVEPASWL